jgi:hypothetical protein
MNIFIELAKNFYGVIIPGRKRKLFSTLVINHLNDRYSIETSIGMALQKMHLDN